MSVRSFPQTSFSTGNTVTWDVDVVLHFFFFFFKEKQNVCPSGSKTLKVTILLLLLSGQRGQMVWLINIRYIMVSNKEVRCVIRDLLKTTRPKHHQKEVVLPAYPPDRRLCIVAYLRAFFWREPNCFVRRNLVC